MSAGLRHRPAGGAEGGYVLVMLLLLCVASAVVVQALSTVVLCAEGALHDEAEGRDRMAEKDSGLAALRREAAQEWGESWSDDLVPGPVEVLGCAVVLRPDVQWVLSATVWQDPAISRLVVSAWLERGRDGLDLPLAPLVAEAMTATAGRESTCVEMGVTTGEAGEGSPTGGPATECAVAHICRLPAGGLLGPGVSVTMLDEPWRMDAGWLYGLATETGEGAVPGAGVTVLSGRAGQMIELPDDVRGATDEAPALVILTGGAGLDAEGFGDVHGVIVVDGGQVLLDGTTVHGAVFATGAVDFGMSGRLVYAESTLRWACDRSLTRVRLVPGTRREGTE